MGLVRIEYPEIFWDAICLADIGPAAGGISGGLGREGHNLEGWGEKEGRGDLLDRSGQNISKSQHSTLTH